MSEIDSGLAHCPRCKEEIDPCYDDLEGESFSEDTFVQTWRITCPRCGVTFNVFDTFTFTDRTYSVL